VRCNGCPASATGEPFGCYGFMSYPIQLETERWLVDRALQMGIGAVVCAKMLRRLDVTGEFAGDLRAQGGRFFQSPAAVVGGWKLPDGPLPMSSDALVELALFRLPSNWELLPFAAVLFGLVPAADAAELLTEERDIVPFLTALRAEDHPAQAQPFVAFFERVVAAARGSFDLVVDG